MGKQQSPPIYTVTSKGHGPKLKEGKGYTVSVKNSSGKAVK